MKKKTYEVYGHCNVICSMQVKASSPEEAIEIANAACADGGRVESYYRCTACDTIASNMEYGDEFGFSDLRDEALEMEKKNENRNQ